MRGPRAEIHAHGSYAGQIVNWMLHGDRDEWEASAERYALDGFLLDGRAVEVRFPCGSMTLCAEGHIISDFVADDRFHGGTIRLKGGRLWSSRGAAPTT